MPREEGGSLLQPFVWSYGSPNGRGAGGGGAAADTSVKRI